MILIFIKCIYNIFKRNKRSILFDFSFFFGSKYAYHFMTEGMLLLSQRGQHDGFYHYTYHPPRQTKRKKKKKRMNLKRLKSIHLTNDEFSRSIILLRHYLLIIYAWQNSAALQKEKRERIHSSRVRSPSSNKTKKRIRTEQCLRLTVDNSQTRHLRREEKPKL